MDEQDEERLSQAIRQRLWTVPVRSLISTRSRSRVAPPPEKAPKSFHPTSSVIKMTTLGPLPCTCAAVGTTVVIAATAEASRPILKLLILLMPKFLRAAQNGPAACAHPNGDEVA